MSHIGIVSAITLLMLGATGCRTIGNRSPRLVPDDYSVKHEIEGNKYRLPFGQEKLDGLIRVEHYGMSTGVVGQKLGGGPYTWYFSTEDQSTLDGAALENIYYGYSCNRLEVISFSFGNLEKAHGDLVSIIRTAPNSKTGCEFASIPKDRYYVSAFGVCGVDELPVAIVLSLKNPNEKEFEQAGAHQRGSAAGASARRR